jgi:threonine dehydrogenase-like Zn-dependent dehydrogenase
VAGTCGAALVGSDRLIIGHESLGRALNAPWRGDLHAGDLIVGIVRRPDPVPCPACARGEWDMCRNGRYTERGIKQRDGYAAARFRIESEFAIKVALEFAS